MGWVVLGILCPSLAAFAHAPGPLEPTLPHGSTVNLSRRSSRIMVSYMCFWLRRVHAPALIEVLLRVFVPSALPLPRAVAQRHRIPPLRVKSFTFRVDGAQRPSRCRRLAVLLRRTVHGRPPAAEALEFDAGPVR